MGPEVRALLDSVLISRYKHVVILASIGMLYLAHLSSVHMLLMKTVLSGNIGLSSLCLQCVATFV